MSVPIKVAIAAGVYVAWPTIAVLCAVAARALWDRFVTRREVQSRLNDDRRAARLRRLCESQEIERLERLWNLPAREPLA